MGSGLTDVAFSTLGALYGEKARSAITALTLFAGFASTVCWPLSAYLVEHLGWRYSCFVYAAIQIGISLPILLLALPRPCLAGPGTTRQHISPDAKLAAGELPTFAALGTVLTLSAGILSMLGVHLLPLLQARGLPLPAAVGLATLVGPSQVGSRVVEMLAGRRYHPIWTMVASAMLVAAGTGLLFADLPVYSAAIVLYGAGNGVGSVARGTLPLALFGSLRYATVMGRLALPVLISMALSPFVAATVFRTAGANLTFGLVALLAAVNVFAVMFLWLLCRGRSGASQA
jgi:hypothetical protein